MNLKEYKDNNGLCAFLNFYFKHLVLLRSTNLLHLSDSQTFSLEWKNKCQRLWQIFFWIKSRSPLMRLWNLYFSVNFHLFHKQNWVSSSYSLCIYGYFFFLCTCPHAFYRESPNRIFLSKKKIKSQSLI